jgi:type VI secretion system secreted protein Hcp
MTETLSLKYAQVKWKDVQQKISGGQGGNTAGGWNLSTNVKA